MINSDKYELQAFFRACKKNGVSFSSTPNYGNKLGPVVVGVNGEKYTIAPDMKKHVQRASLPPSAGKVSVLGENRPNRVAMETVVKRPAYSSKRNSLRVKTAGG